MKKITLSVAALAIAISSYGQKPFSDSTKRVLVSEQAKQAKHKHINYYEIVITAEDMLTMLDEDIFHGNMQEYYAIYYQDLLKKIIDLVNELPPTNKDFENPAYREQVYKQTEVERR
tara:strand:+ start:78 stop:428 length:351 start_codon:yes stop_codon:yes gene_type:complete